MSKAKEFAADRSSIYDELMKIKSALLTKEIDFSTVSHDSDVAKQALLDKVRFCLAQIILL